MAMARAAQAAPMMNRILMVAFSFASLQMPFSGL
jgi:hypothetical protein